MVVIRMVLGVTLLVAAMPKIRRPEEFLQAVYAYELLKRSQSTIVAIALPFLELVFGFCLIAGWLIRGASLGAVLMFLVFSVAVAAAWWRGLDISCGCFDSRSSSPISTQTVFETGLL